MDAKKREEDSPNRLFSFAFAPARLPRRLRPAHLGGMSGGFVRSLNVFKSLYSTVFPQPASVLILIFFLSIHTAYGQRFERLRVDTTESISFRGLSVVDDSVAWVSGTRGTIGRTVNGGRTWNVGTIRQVSDGDFRSLYAFDSLSAVAANAGSPAYIFLTTDGGSTWAEVYRNDDSAAFFDGVDFLDGQTGYFYGDPIGGRLLFVRTSDRGASWSDVPSERRPEVWEGEFSFAASGTGIRCFSDGRLMIATGGSVARLFESQDGGGTWKSLRTPMLQGLPSAGIFSLTFFDEHAGVIVGGDYQRADLEQDHVFFTPDGGATWHAPRFGTRGYRECVEVTDSSTVIATGPTGTDISTDRGATWLPMSNEKGFHVVRRARRGTLTLIAGGSGKVSIVR